MIDKNVHLRSHFFFQASHILETEDRPQHEHDWHMVACITGPALKGKIIDLMAFRSTVESLLDGLSGTFLNENSLLDMSAQQMPTCETLGMFLATQMQQLMIPFQQQENPQASLAWVEIGIAETGQLPLGWVRIFPEDLQDG